MIRYALSRRWLTWHLLWAAIVVVCLRLAIWQWEVAGAPHVPGAPVQTWRNYAYAVNWVIFAVVGAWFWWRFMRDQRAAEVAAAAAAGDPSEPAAASAQASAQATTPTTPTRQSVPPVSVRDPVTGGRVRFDPFADSAESAEGARDDPPTGR